MLRTVRVARSREKALFGHEPGVGIRDVETAVVLNAFFSRTESEQAMDVPMC